jgi:hypothetical protein
MFLKSAIETGIVLPGQKRGREIHLQGSPASAVLVGCGLHLKEIGYLFAFHSGPGT